MRTMTTKTCENCSKAFPIRVSDVARGRGRFCGKSCAASGKNNSAYRHGESTRTKGQSKEYKTWAGIKQRTTNPSEMHGHYYQDRGIKMCDRWLDSFENFLEDMGRAPSPKHSIDRIDNDGDYSPENCRWATHQEQMANTRVTKLIEYNGQKHHQEEWGRITGLGGLTILKRLKRGWSIEDALTRPKS
jgi:hypothetical protein